MHEVRRGRHRAVVQTTAASALGRMIVKLGKRLSLLVINVCAVPSRWGSCADWARNTSSTAANLNSTRGFASYAIGLGPPLDLMPWPARCPPSCWGRSRAEAACLSMEPYHCKRATLIRHP
jgi:hypothetical protein